MDELDCLAERYEGPPDSRWWVCLNMLRARDSRREQPSDVHMPDPVVSRADAVGPDHEAVLGDSVGLALLVVLDTLAPAERLAFVLHDMFAVPFDEIAPVAGCSAVAARQLASRARRRVRKAAPPPDGQPVSIMGFTVRNGKIVAIDVLADPDRLRTLDLTAGAD
jgi:hypothetical protein